MGGKINPIVAYCGLACDTCPIHVATLEQDEAKQRSMRAEITKTFVEQYGMSIQIKNITDCDGCRAGTRLFSGCAKCEIRKCAMERGIESCAFCHDYARQKLLKFIGAEPSARARLEELKRNAQ